ncbi:T-cell immunoglobulin and mucin domain-containing protein 4-like [Oryzias latipes]|uniref:T-cell immunoglobulin and mucin domain-containing protein 4-like n=1 Tax=Oryzias latipes TaxID=8090 RepID=UPI000CE1F08A|nr:T-cell immunoglobulin and mucin domain-containing protein 4-like [Oryzias latipes]
MKILLLLLALLTVSECDRKLTGRIGQSITLPCKYDIKTNGPTKVCWGRGRVPISGCSDKLLATDGHKVKAETQTSSRYQLLGRLDEGDVSLTIVNVTEEDAGMYGCRVKISGLFNDEKHNIQLTVKPASDCDDDGIVAHVGQDVTLRCGYNISTNGEIPVCWGRDAQYILGCRNELLATDGSRVKEERRASCRYQMLGHLNKGDVSLTIRNVTEEDSGLYACRVEIPGMFNDELYYMDLSVVKASPSIYGQEQSSRTDCRTSAESLE